MTAPPARTRPRPRRRWIVAAVVGTTALVTAAIVVPVWGWASTAAAGQVEVVAGPGQATCDDGRRLDVRAAEEDDRPSVVYRLDGRRGAWCQIPLSVRNDGSHTVTVGRLDFPAMLRDKGGSGKGGNAGALVVDSDASLVPARRLDDSNTAVIDVDEQIEPGESLGMLVRVDINPYACQSAGPWRVSDVPQVHFSVLGRNHVTSSAITLEADIRGNGLTWSGCTN